MDYRWVSTGQTMKLGDIALEHTFCCYKCTWMDHIQMYKKSIYFPCFPLLFKPYNIFYCFCRKWVHIHSNQWELSAATYNCFEPTSMRCAWVRLCMHLQLKLFFSKRKQHNSTFGRAIFEKDDLKYFEELHTTIRAWLCAFKQTSCFSSVCLHMQLNAWPIRYRKLN